MKMMFTLAALLLGGIAHAGQLASVSLIDSSTGEALRIWHHGGRHYVVGTPGQRYRIQVQNKTGGRLLAVVAVDGINVISGETASPDQPGYVAAPWQPFTVDGWRKSMDDVAAFYFTRVADSYAGRTGRAGQTGVIGVALFRELPPPPPPVTQDSYAEGAASVAEAPRAAAAPAPERRLGTGHGERLSSSTRYTSFERASPTADEVIVVYYDSRARLIERGVIPRSRPQPEPRPQAFPGGFVPDPD